MVYREDALEDPSVSVSICLAVAAATGGQFQLRASKALHEGVRPLLVLQQTLVRPFPQSHNQVHQSETHTNLIICKLNARESEVQFCFVARQQRQPLLAILLDTRMKAGN